jgi:hypothetical protein
MTKEEQIKKSLERDTDISREEYAEKMRQADAATAAHGVAGEAPLTEGERERRMRMNYYGTMVNIGMSILAAIDELTENIKILNNNIVILSGGEANGSNDTSSERASE